MPGGPSSDIRFTDRLHGNSRLHPGIYPTPFQCILHGQTVHHRGQHTHVVGGGAVHAFAGPGHAPEDISCPDHQTDFDAQTDDGLDLRCNKIDHSGTDPERIFTHKRFTAQFQQYPSIFDLHQSAPVLNCLIPDSDRNRSRSIPCQSESGRTVSRKYSRPFSLRNQSADPGR